MHWLLRLYPRAWRERYEEEMSALLEEYPATPATIADLLLGALDANLNFSGLTEGVEQMVQRLRSGLVMVFCAFMCYGVGWCALQRMNDPLPLFQAVNAHHPELGVLYRAIFLTGCLAFLAFLAGGLPVLFFAAKRALQNKQRNVLTPFGIALSCLLIFLISTVGLAVWRQQIASVTPCFLHAVVAYLILAAVELIVGTIAIAWGLTRTNFRLQELNWLYVPEVVIVFGMAATVLLSVLLIVMLTAYAPQLFETQDVSSPMFVVGILCMAVGTLFAWLGVKRGSWTLIRPLR